MMKWCLLLIVLMLTSGCSQPSAEEEAAKAAKHYYEQLSKGHYPQFLDGVALPEWADDDYRSQLTDNYKEFVARQALHGNISKISIAHASIDTTQRTVNVFLTLCFGDSTNEEVVVPMIERNGRWQMK